MEFGWEDILFALTIVAAVIATIVASYNESAVTEFRQKLVDKEDELEETLEDLEDARYELKTKEEELVDARRQLQEVMLEVAYNGYELKIVPEKVIPERVEPERVEMKKVGK